MAQPVVQPLIAVTSAANVPITAMIPCRRVEIIEDGSGSQAGLVVTWPNGTVANYIPSQQPIVLGAEDGHGPLIGIQANANNRGGAATQYCQVKSMGAATVVRVTETP